MPARSDQRKQLRSQRHDLTESERRERSASLCSELARRPVFRNSKRIAAYLPVDGEIETASLIELAWNMGKQVYLPVLIPHCANRLWFARYEPGAQLVTNRFGIAEPEVVHRRRIAPHALDLVLAPLVGFDRTGHRLGMGGGFYDRSFAYLLSRKYWRKPHLVGLAYDFQQLPRLSAQPWDVPLTAVATDTGWHLFQKGKVSK